MSTQPGDGGHAESPLRFDVWLSRTKTVAGHFSVRTKIIGIVLALTTVLGLGITWQVRSALDDVLVAELENQGEAQAIELASQLTRLPATADLSDVTRVFDNGVVEHLDTVYAFVADADGGMIAYGIDADAFGSVESVGDPPVGPGVDIDAALGAVREYEAPIADGSLGVVHVGVSEARLARVVTGVTLQLLLTTLLIGALGVAAATLLTWMLTRPILDLVEATQRVASGDLSTRASAVAEDEIGTLTEAFNHMVEDLEENRMTIAENEDARTRLLEQLIGAQEDERKRIARELHDSVGQSLSSIMLGASLIERSNAPAETRERASELRHLSAETLKDVRRLGRSLRPSVLDDLGLAAALDRYAAEFQLQYPEIVADVHCDLPERLTPNVETMLYRVVQEGMTNVARHSGARTVSVLVTQGNGYVQTIIEDDGVGFDPELERRNGQSVGIHGMIERTELLNGRLDIESGSSGTTVYVEVPLANRMEAVE